MGIASEDVEDGLLHHLYLVVLRLVSIIEARFETSLDEDEALLALADACVEESVAVQPEKRHRGGREVEREWLPPGVRLENFQNILVLRVGQKRILRELRDRILGCFESEGGDDEAY